MSPITETFLVVVSLCVSFVAIGIAWVIYLSRGRQPFSINFRGLGMTISVDRSSERRKSNTPVSLNGGSNGTMD